MGTVDYSFRHHFCEAKRSRESERLREWAAQAASSNIDETTEDLICRAQIWQERQAWLESSVLSRTWLGQLAHEVCTARALHYHNAAFARGLPEGHPHR